MYFFTDKVISLITFSITPLDVFCVTSKLLQFGIDQNMPFIGLSNFVVNLLEEIISHEIIESEHKKVVCPHAYQRSFGRKHCRYLRLRWRGWGQWQWAQAERNLLTLCLYCQSL
jgi:hypothetical protein